MAQPTGSTPSTGTYSASHTRRAGDTFAVSAQQFTTGTGDGTMAYGASGMAAVTDQAGPALSNRYGELFSLVSPPSGAQSMTPGGTGTPRGIAVRSYDTTTNALVTGRTTSAADDSDTIAFTRAAPAANDLGQLFVYLNGSGTTVASTSGCTVVTYDAEDAATVVVLDVSGANPSITLSGTTTWIAFAFDVEGTGGAPVEVEPSLGSTATATDTLTATVEIPYDLPNDTATAADVLTVAIETPGAEVAASLGSVATAAAVLSVEITVPPVVGTSSGSRTIGAEGLIPITSVT